MDRKRVRCYSSARSAFTKQNDESREKMPEKACTNNKSIVQYANEHDLTMYCVAIEQLRV